MAWSSPGNKTRAWQRFQAAADALRGLLPAAPCMRQLIYKPMHVSEAFKDGVRADSEKALRLARDAGLAVDMTNNWPQTK